MKTLRFLLAILIVSFTLILLVQPQALTLAAPPQNDDFDFATEIQALPFHDSLDTTDATLAPDDPYSPCSYYGAGATVWYRFTASESRRVALNTAGSAYSTVIAIYTGERGALNFVNCAAGWYLEENLVAGETYAIMISATGDPYPGPYPYPYPGPGDPVPGGWLEFSLESVPAPGNDHFADAYEISPDYYDSGNNINATLEPSEPRPSCALSDPGKTVWYRYTPAVTETLLINSGSAGGSVLAIYTGSELSSLVEQHCFTEYTSPPVRLEAGATYYFQLGDLGNVGGYFYFHLTYPPQLEARFSYLPYAPSRFETITFYDDTYDPLYIGIASQTWDFGDGTTAEGQWVTHRYDADGDYTVTLTVVTHDGRTDTTFQWLTIATHDIAVTKIDAPKSVKAGQTKTIKVELRSYFLPESATLQFFKSSRYGFDILEYRQVDITENKGKLLITVAFTYTFTEEDAIVGKVIFKAAAPWLQDGYDFFPADNELISQVITVKP